MAPITRKGRIPSTPQVKGEGMRALCPNRMLKCGSVAALVLAATGLSACGSSSSSSISAAATSTASPAATTSGPISLPTGRLRCGATTLGDDPCKVPAAPPAGKHIRLGYFALANNTFASAIEQGVTQTAVKYNASVTVLLNPFDPSVQQSQIRDSLAAHKFDAYIVEPSNPAALRPLFQEMVSSNIPFSTVGIINGTDNSTTKNLFPGQTLQTSRPTDSYAGDAATATEQACGATKPCRVGLMRGTATLPFDTSDASTFLADVKKDPNIQVVQTVFGQYLSSAAQTAMENLITVHPDLNVIVTLGDQMSVGAEKAIDKAGKAKQIQIVSVGGGSTAAAAIRAHRWFASVLTLPINEGIIATTATIAAARGEKLSLGIANIDTRASLPRVLTQRNESQWPHFNGQWSGL